jgi:hypothetical protein
MDPYLEEPSLWGGAHTRLMTAIADDLAERLAPHFIVGLEERVYVVGDDEARRPVVPDVYLATRAGPSPGGGATAPATPPTLVRPLQPVERRERHVEVRDPASRRVLATIEVLSPVNKAPGDVGRERSLGKWSALMAADVNWIGIDVLRAGQRPPEVAGRGDYDALLWRGRAAEAFEVWDADLRDRLPTIVVPLRTPIAETTLDLQALVAGIYRRGRYADSLDDDRPPPPRLRPADAAWAEERIRAWRAARMSRGTGVSGGPPIAWSAPPNRP